MNWRLLLTLLAPIILAAPGCAAPRDITITVDPQIRFQTMSGWEVTPRVWEYDKSADRYSADWVSRQDEVLDTLVGEAGIDRVRLEVSSASENPVDQWKRFESGELSYSAFRKVRYQKINDNDDPWVAEPKGFTFGRLDYEMTHVVLPVKRRVEASGRRFVLNLCYVDFKWAEDQGSLSHANNPEEYAELIAVTFDHLKARYGLTPDYFEIVLEPDNTRDWRGPQVGRALVAVKRRLAAAGYHPMLVAPSTSKAAYAASYFDQAMATPGAAGAIGVLSYHRYDEALANAALPGIRARAKQFGLETAMSEHTTGGVEELFADLTRTHVSSWQQWAIATPPKPDGALRDGWLINVRPEGLALTPTAAKLAQVFRHVPVGAVRISAARDPAAPAVAFQNPRGDRVALVLTPAPARVTIRGLGPGAYDVSLVTSSGRRILLPSQSVVRGRAVVIDAPQAGVLAVAGRPAV